MAAAGSLITAQDYNDLHDKVAQILGTGSGSYGYGQSVNSTPVVAVSSSNPDPTAGRITSVQWEALRLDLINIGIHQTGSLPPTIVPEENTLIGYGASYPVVNYNILASNYLTNRFDIATSQANITVKATTPTYTGSWFTQATCTATINFPSSTVARYFFNSGGKIRFTSSRTGGSVTVQNGAWTNLLNSIGAQGLTGNPAQENNFYSLNTSFKTFYNRENSTPYSMNYYRLEARTPGVPDNSTGLATQVEIKVTLRDEYTAWIGPFGGIYSETGMDGNLVISLDELKVAPNSGDGTFNVDPTNLITYSITSITAS